MTQGHMDRLTSFDTSFLANERQNGHMALGAIMVCEGAAPSLEDFNAHIRSRLHLLPRFRQRSSSRRCSSGAPFWVDFPEFDIAQHVRHVTLPAPGTDAQFHELVGALPLAAARPLASRSGSWSLVDGFEDDRFAIVYKTHHSLADGISAVDIGVLLFDVEPKSELVREEVPWEPAPGRRRSSALAGRAAQRHLARRSAAAVPLARAPLVAARGAPRRARQDGIAGICEVSWA